MKETSMEPEVAELQGLLMDLQSAIKFSRLYPLDHPLLKKALVKATAGISSYLEIHQKLNLRIRLADIYSGATLLNRNHEPLQHWARNLYALGIQELILFEGASHTEILKFITTTGLSAENLAEKGGIDAVWEQENFSAIRINMTLREEIQRIFSAFSALELQEHHEIQTQAVALLDFLSGEAKELKSGAGQLLDDLLDRPQHLAGILLNSARSQGASGTGASAFELSQWLMKPLTRIVGVLENGRADLKEARCRQLAQAVNCLNGELRTAVTAQIVSASGIGANQAAFAPLSHLLESNNNPAQQVEGGREREGGDKWSQFLQPAPLEMPQVQEPDIPHREKSNVEMAANAGWEPILNTDDVSEMQKRTFLKDDQIAEATSFTPLELKIIEDLLKSLRDPMTEEPFWHAASKMIWLLDDPASLEVLGTSMRERMHSMLAQGHFTGFALGVRIIEGLASQPQLPGTVKELLLHLRDEIKGPAIRRQVLAAVRGADKSDPKAAGIIDYLSQLSGEATEDLLQWLEFEEQRWLRRFICQHLAQQGIANIETLWQYLSSPRWYMVRNVLSVLGMINDPRSISHVAPLIQHPHPLVRKEVLKTLGLSGSAEAFASIAQACEDGEEEVKIAAIESLGVLRDPRAKPVLYSILRRKDYFLEKVDLKKAAINALNFLGDLDAIPLLDRLSRRSWFSFSSRHQEVSQEARKALEQLRRKRLHEHRTQSQLPGTAD